MVFVKFWIEMVKQKQIWFLFEHTKTGAKKNNVALVEAEFNAKGRNFCRKSDKNNHSFSSFDSYSLSLSCKKILNASLLELYCGVFCVGGCWIGIHVLFI